MKIVLKILSIVVLLSLFCVGSFNVHAEEITSFSSQIVAHQDGTMDITENIVYDFGDLSRHGIFRDIPTITRVGDLYRIITIDFKSILRDGISESYSLTSDNTKTSVKIGQANETIAGTHTYTIEYVVGNGIGSNYEDHDEIYWNITGSSWKVPILKAFASLSTDFGVVSNKAVCFTGAQGSTAKDCLVGKNNTINTINTTSGLNASEGLTGVWSFAKDTFPPSILQTNLPQNSMNSNNEISQKTVTIIIVAILIVVIFLNFILAPGLLIWYFKKKRKARFGMLSVNFDFPEDNGKRVAPAEAGSIDVYQVDQNDVIATIFDLAIRKYLKIVAIKSEKVLGIFGGGDDFEFTKLKNYYDGTTTFEKNLLSVFFRDEDRVKISSLKKDFYITFQSFEKDVFESLIERGFYTKNPKNQMILLLVAGIFVIFFGGLLLGLVLIFLSRKLNGRTAKGDEMDFKIDGLKIFLKNMSREHTWYAKNLITVEKYIPYAIALGYVKEFMEQLKAIYPNYQPSWYSGNMVIYLAMDNMQTSMGSTFTTHASSSSSGFSGGGFSGGGGGGGGGGSW